MKKKRWLLLIAMLIAVMMLPITANAAVKLNKKAVTLTVGKTVQLKVKGTKNKVNWSSTNKNVAVVNKKGKVSAKSAGSVTIKAKVGKKTLKCKVTVNAPVTPAPAPAPTSAPTSLPEPSLSATKLDLIAGQQKQLTLNNASGNVAWSSSNHRVAGVDSDGTVYAKFYGTCTIKATCGGKSYSCNVSVTFPNPECYPKTRFSAYGSEVRIDTFEAKFVAYQLNRTDVGIIASGDDGPYYGTCIYRIHLKGNVLNTSQFYPIFATMWEGYVNEFFGSYMEITPDKNGDFDIIKDITFAGPAEIIYLNSF